MVRHVGDGVELTEDLTRLFAEKVGQGCYPSVVARELGLSPRTVRQWLTWGKRGRGEPYNAFFAAVTRARAEAQNDAVATLRGLGREDWRALAWYLERSDPKRWGNRLELVIKPNAVKRLAREAGVSAAEMEQSLKETLAALTEGADDAEADAW